MITVEDFSRLVSGIYTAAVAPQHWEAAIRDIHQTVGGIGCSLALAEGAVWSIENSTMPASALQSYAAHYHRIDPVLAAVERGPVGVVRTGTELVAPHRKSEFYVGWMRPNELEDGLFVRLTGGARPTCLIVASADGSESFGTPERVKVIDGLVPHLQQALRTRGKLAALAQANANLTRALDAVRHGMIIVGSEGWLIDLNTAAERILRAEDGLQTRCGRVGATSMPTQRKLYGAIHLAVLSDGSGVCRGNSFTCERPSGKRPYVLHILPLRGGRVGETPSDAAALVLIVDPDHEPEPATSLLRRVYGLTNTEANVALSIVRGEDLHQISEQLSISITTVRTHLKHVFDKTDTHRQAELVRRLLTLGA